MALVYQILTRPLLRPCNEAKKERTLHAKCEGAKETMRHSSVLTVQKNGKKKEIKNCTLEGKVIQETKAVYHSLTTDSLSPDFSAGDCDTCLHVAS